MSNETKSLDGSPVSQEYKAKRLPDRIFAQGKSRIGVRQLGEDLKAIAMACGTHPDEFENMNPLDTCLSYAFHLSHGRIATEKDARPIIDAALSAQHYIDSVSKPSCRVPDRHEIDDVLAGRADVIYGLEDVPDPAEQLDSLVTHLREVHAERSDDLTFRERLRSNPGGVDVESGIRDGDGLRVLRCFSLAYGSPATSHADLATLKENSTRMTPAEWVAWIDAGQYSDKPKREMDPEIKEMDKYLEDLKRERAKADREAAKAEREGGK